MKPSLKFILFILIGIELSFVRSVVFNLVAIAATIIYLIIMRTDRKSVV
jgi:NhaP-type Na+/H+ or K+/H+ antiporter